MLDVRVAMAAIACFLLAPGTAAALDQPIMGGRLQLRTLASGKQKLVFRSNDPTFSYPLRGDTDDPLTQGLVVELFAPAAPSASMTAPATGADPGWTFGKGTYKFRRGATPATVTPIKKVVIKRGRQIVIAADATGLAMTAPLARVGVRVRTGTLRNCASFGDAAVVADVPGKFGAKNAPPPADCSTATLTGMPPTCGDDEVNQSTEQCDGVDRAFCAQFGFDCRLPGAVGECSCCSTGGAYASTVGCCNPSSLLIPMSPSSAMCVSTRCDPPYGCDAGDVCQGDGSCCTSLGATCQLIYPIAATLNPCCPGLECSGPVTDGFTMAMSCCVPESGACTSAAECCTRHCEGDGTCGPCGAAGSACTTILDCCSRSCNASTAQCDP
jgi:hypothetical protein